jgi:hypothetical protein
LEWLGAVLVLEADEANQVPMVTDLLEEQNRKWEKGGQTPM